MKSLSKTFLLMFILSIMLSSCTENTITEDDQIVLEIQATDKEDSVNPNNNGEDPDSNEEG